MEALLLLILLFYILGIPLWLILVTSKVKNLQSELHYLQSHMHETGQQAKALAASRSKAPSVVSGVTATDTENRATPSSTEHAPKQRSAGWKSFEEQVGLHWFQWLGIAALIIALIFFLKWAFDNGFVGPAGRTVIGYVLAGAAMIAGDKLRRMYGTWSLAFTGGGAMAAYIVTWIALHMYELFPPFLALILYSLTTIVTCLLAGYYRALPLAIFGILGGFLTPVLAGEDGSVLGLLSYILIIDIGVLALGYSRQWRVLNAFAFLGTILWQMYALDDAGIDRTYAFFFLACFGAIYVAIPALYNIRQQRKSEPGDILILVGNGLFHFWLLLQWLDTTPIFREYIDGPVALVFSLLFLVVSVGIYQKNRSDTPLVLSGISLTVLFASIAIALQLGDAWISLAWSIEAVFLLWAALRLNDSRIQRFAWPVMFAAYCWYLFVPGAQSPTVFHTSGFLLFLLWAAALIVIALSALQREDRTSQHLLPFVLMGGIFLTLSLLFNLDNPRQSTLTFMQRCIEAVVLIGGSYAVLWKAKERWSTLHVNERKAFAMLAIAAQVVTLGYLSYEYSHAVKEGVILAGVTKKTQIVEMGLSILWAIYAAGALVVSFVKQWRLLRLFGMSLLLVAIAKLTLIDLVRLGTGYRVIGFTVLGAVLIGASFLYQRNKEQLKDFFTSDSHPSS